MWLLTTRRRPALAAECLAACVETGMISRGVVYIDGDERGEYGGLVLPANWTLHVAEHAGLSAALQWCLATFPGESIYGWLADDMMPRTYGWDAALEAAAGSCRMSQCRDEWVFNFAAAAVRDGREPSAGLCWGGDLIRAVGWWALPGTFQGGTDVAWTRLAHRLRLMRFVDAATIEHRHWRLGKRPRDEVDTDMLDANGHEHTQRDVARLYEWLASPDFVQTQRRIRLGCR